MAKPKPPATPPFADSVRRIGELALEQLDQLLPEDFPEADATRLVNWLGTVATVAYYVGCHDGNHGHPYPAESFREIFARFEQD